MSLSSSSFYNRRAAALGLAAAALFLSACKPTAGGPPNFGPVEVGFVELKQQPLTLTTQLPGRTAAFLTAEIRPQVNGVIQSRLFAEGSYVHAGDILYRLDPIPYEATVNQAKATLTAAEADLGTVEANLPALKARAERLKELAAARAVGQQDSDDAAAAYRQALASVNARKASIETARAALDTARVNLNFTPLKAPISGRIGRSGVTVGALATAYQPTALATIQQIDKVFVDVVQSNADLLRLRHSLESGRLQRGAQANRVKLILEDGSTYPITGALEFRDFTVDPTTGAVTLRMVFPNPREVLLPGMFIRAEIEEGLRKDAILIPQEAVARDPKGNPFCWIVGAGDKVERRALELERALGPQWLVLSGVNAGDRVIVEGTQKVRAGVPIRPVPSKTPTAAPAAAPTKAGAHV